MTDSAAPDDPEPAPAPEASRTMWIRSVNHGGLYARDVLNVQDDIETITINRVLLETLLWEAGYVPSDLTKLSDPPAADLSDLHYPPEDPAHPAHGHRQVVNSEYPIPGHCSECWYGDPDTGDYVPWPLAERRGHRFHSPPPSPPEKP